MGTKKGELKSFLIIAIPIVIIGIIISLLYVSTQVPEDHPIRKITDGIKNIILGENNNSPPKPEYNYTIPASAGGGGGSPGGGSGDGGGSSGVTLPDCDKQTISYALLHPMNNITCTNYDGSVCIEKTVNCSIDVRNREEVGVGYFAITVNIIQETDTTNPIATEVKNLEVNALDTKTINHFGIITSIGIDGYANKDLRCTFRAEDAPYSC